MALATAAATPALTVFDKTQGVQNVHRYVCGETGPRDRLVHKMLPVVAIIPPGPGTLKRPGQQHNVAHGMTGMSQRGATLLDVERDTRSRVLGLVDRQFDSQKRILGELLDHGVGTREQAV